MVSNPKPPLRGSHRAQPTASRKGAFPIARSPRDHRVVRVHLAHGARLRRTSASLNTQRRGLFITHFGSPRSNMRMRWFPRALWFVHYRRGQPSRAKCVAPPASSTWTASLLQNIRHQNVTSTRLGGVWAPIVLLFLTSTVLNQVPNAYVLVRYG